MGRALLADETQERNLRGSRVELRPHPYKLVQVVWAENRLITCEVFKVVHDDSHEKIQKLSKKAKEMR